MQTFPVFRFLWRSDDGIICFIVLTIGISSNVLFILVPKLSKSQWNPYSPICRTHLSRTVHTFQIARTKWPKRNNNIFTHDKMRLSCMYFGWRKMNPPPPKKIFYQIYLHSIEHLAQLYHHFRLVAPMLLDQRKMFERHDKRYIFYRMKFPLLLYDDIAWIEGVFFFCSFPKFNYFKLEMFTDKYMVRFRQPLVCHHRVFLLDLLHWIYKLWNVMVVVYLSIDHIVRSLLLSRFAVKIKSKKKYLNW